jgi:glycosyltransferase involved in cell wall biosynthesis
MLAISPNDECIFFMDPWTKADFTPPGPNSETLCIDQSAAPSRAAGAETFRSPSDMLRLTRATRKQKLDVFFYPSVYTYFPSPPRLASVVTIHDAIAEKFPALTLPTIRARLFWSMKVRLAVWQARIILTVSKYSANDLTSQLHIRPDRIRVTSEAPAASYRPSESAGDIQAAAARIGIPTEARWLTYVGGFNPHKRLDVIVRAHAAIAKRNRNFPLYLVLVGAPERDVFHGDLEAIRAAISREGTEHLVKWTGFVPDEELRHLHSGAIALLLVSESEGFGLPAVEAAACGTPVIATKESPLPDLLSGGGFFVSPGNVPEVIEAIHTLTNDDLKRKQLGHTARLQAEKLSWAASARVVMDALRDAAT